MIRTRMNFVLLGVIVAVLVVANAAYCQETTGFEGWVVEGVWSKYAQPGSNTNFHIGETLGAGAATVTLKGINDEEARLEVARGDDVKRITLGSGNSKIVQLGDRRYLVINLYTDPDRDWIRLVVVTFRSSK